MSEFTMPLTLEEEAALLLYLELQPHLKGTIGDHDRAKEIIRNLVYDLARTVRDEYAETLTKKQNERRRE